MPTLLGPAAESDLRRLAQAAYPEEAVGFLVGKRHATMTRVARVVGAPNVHSGDRHRAHRAPPAALLELEEQLAGTELETVGFFHSHPDAPAVPSRADQDAAWPGYVYVIVPIDTAGAGTPSAWRLRDDRSAFDADAIVRDGAANT